MHSRELPILTRLEKLDEALADINKHNRSLCCGCVVDDFNPDLLNAFFSGEVERTAELASTQRSAPLNVREIICNHGSCLRQAGLELVVKDQNQIGIVLADIDKATNFVFKIPQGWSNAKVITELARTVEPFIESLTLIDDQNVFSQRTQDTRFLVDLMSRRRMAGGLEGVRILLNAAEGGYFKEQTLVNDSRLLDEKFTGPKGWHLKMTPENLHSHWKNALGTFREVRRNSNASELANDLEKVLRDGLEKFESSVNSENGPNTSNGDKHGKVKAIAQIIRLDFEEILRS